MKTGIRNSPIRNAFERVSVTNSEEATIWILRIHLSSGDANEDVVQRRAGDLEVIDGGPRGELPEERLRVSRQADFLELAVVVDCLDARQVGQRRGAARAPDADRIQPVGRLNVLERPVEHLAARGRS